MKALVALIGAAGLATAANAVTVTSTVGPDTLPASYDLLIDYEGGLAGLAAQGVTASGNFAITDAHPSPAQPWGNDDFYFVVPGDGTSGEATLTFDFGSRQVREFSFYWGSIDTYNTVEIRDAGSNLIATVNGNDIYNPASGDQGSPFTNQRVNFKLDAGQSLGSITFISNGYAFEHDDIAISFVPEPATWAMLIAGFGMVGFAARRRRAAGLAQTAA